MSGIGRSGKGVLKVDGEEVARQKMNKTIPLILQWDGTFDIGSDTGTPVDDAEYKKPFAFTEKQNRLTLRLDRPQLSEGDVFVECRMGPLSRPKLFLHARDNGPKLRILQNVAWKSCNASGFRLARHRTAGSAC